MSAAAAATSEVIVDDERPLKTTAGSNDQLADDHDVVSENQKCGELNTDFASSQFTES